MRDTALSATTRPAKRRRLSVASSEPLPQGWPESAIPLWLKVSVKLQKSVFLQMVLASLAASITGAFISIVGASIALVLVLAAVATVAVWRYPPLAGYVMMAVAPSVVGFERGHLLPIVRPNEALLFFLGAVLFARWLICSRQLRLRPEALDFAMVALLLTGFFMPLLVQLFRQRPIPTADIFYAAVFIRLLVLYYLFRVTIRTTQQVRVALGVSLATASLMGLLGTAGALNIAGLGELLHATFAESVNFTYSRGRGFGLIGNPIGYGVYEAIHACVAIALLLSGQKPRLWLGAAAVCCTVGLFGSAQFGPLIAFVVGLGAMALVTRNVGRVLRWSLPVLLLASLVIVPLFGQRLDRLDGVGLSSQRRDAIQQEINPGDQGRELYFANPGSSWDVRLYNLEQLFLPEFTSPAHWVWGVTPQARVFAPPTGRDYAWIESGILWLLWTGGIPLLLAWFALIGAGCFVSVRLLSRSSGLLAAVGAATFAAVMIVNVAQIADPHVTLRGTVDIFYPLLAIAMTSWVIVKADVASALKEPATAALD